jgi:hypothetical protein
MRIYNWYKVTGIASIALSAMAVIAILASNLLAHVWPDVWPEQTELNAHLVLMGMILFGAIGGVLVGSIGIRSPEHSLNKRGILIGMLVIVVIIVWGFFPGIRDALVCQTVSGNYVVIYEDRWWCGFR